MEGTITFQGYNIDDFWAEMDRRQDARLDKKLSELVIKEDEDKPISMTESRKFLGMCRTTFDKYRNYPESNSNRIKTHLIAGREMCYKSELKGIKNKQS